MQSDTGDDVVGLLAALSQDPANEKLITSVSRNASSAVFCQEFAAKGLPLLFHSLQVCNQRAGRANVLRALTLLLEDKTGRKSLEQCVFSADLFVTLLGLVMSDTVLSVARALHVLSVLTEPNLVSKRTFPPLMEALNVVAVERGRTDKPLAFLRCAFVGFALLDANIHGMAVARHLMETDASMLRLLDEANVLQAVFALCENEALVGEILLFQTCIAKCWRDRANIPVAPELPEHLALLERLWVAAVPNKPFPGKSNPEWRYVGFQGDAPASDFRSMGLLALDQLVYFVENCSTEARMIISVQSGQSADLYYPVATAGIIVSSLLLSAIEQRLKTSELIPVILSEPASFAKLWTVLFRHFDTLFVENKLTYLQFGDLTKAVTSQFSDVLAQNPLSMNDVASLLKSAAESSPVFGAAKKKRNKALSAQWMAQRDTNMRMKDKVAVGEPEKIEKVFLAPLPATPVKPVRGHARETKLVGKKLRKACQLGDAKKVIELLGKEKGEAYALVNDPDGETRATALHFAAANGHIDCVTLLRGAGAALESIAVGMGTPLHCAAQNGRLAVVEALIDGGAKLNSINGPEGRTPLMVAAAAGFADVISFLVARGADVNVTDSEGFAAGAFWTGSSDIANLLGNKKKRLSGNITFDRASNSNVGNSNSNNSISRMEREIQSLRQENAELRSLLAEMDKRVTALESSMK